jgi:hypothetical protein
MLRARAHAPTAQASNGAGTIGGGYEDSSDLFHGFVRVASATITSFEAPGAGTAAGQGTKCWSINNAGAIAGYYFDASTALHGFARTASGVTVQVVSAVTGPAMVGRPDSDGSVRRQ